MHFAQLVQRIAKADFDESLHPRAADGKFGQGPGGDKKSKKPKAPKALGPMTAREHAIHQKRLGALTKARAALKAKREAATPAPLAPAAAKAPIQRPPSQKQQAALRRAQAKVAAEGQAKTPPAQKAPQAPRTKLGKVPQVAPAPLKADERAALAAYQYSAFTNMQESLRAERPTAKTKALDAAIAKQTIQNEATVYRGIGGPMAAQYVKICKPGAKLREKGFTSTSASQSVAQTFARANDEDDDGRAVFHITLPKGHAALDVAQHLDNREAHKEREVLLGSRTLFEVSHVTQQRGVHHIYMRALSS